MLTRRVQVTNSTYLSDFCQVSQPHRDPVNSKKNTYCFRNSPQDSWNWPLHFFSKNCLRLMRFPWKICHIESISHFKSTSNHSNQLPSAVCPDSRWSLAALAISMAGRKASPKLHAWKWEALRIKNIMKNICVCYYRHDKSCIMYTRSKNTVMSCI